MKKKIKIRKKRKLKRKRRRLTDTPENDTKRQERRRSLRGGDVTDRRYCAGNA